MRTHNSKRLPRALFALAIGIALVCASLVVVATYLYNHDPLMLKLCVGRARLLTEEQSAIVSANGKPIPGARCFRISSKMYDRKPCDGFAIWIPQSIGSRAIIV